LVPPDAAADDENDGSLFTIELNERYNTLKASTPEEAQSWVLLLKQLQSSGSKVDGQEEKGNPDAYVSEEKKGEGKAEGEGEGDEDGWKKEGRLFGCC
jgi:hypothetical protein